MDDETFFAWLDGELEPVEASRVAALVAASPDLSAKADSHRRLKADLAAAFAPVTRTPAPAGLGAARAPAPVVELAAERKRPNGLPSAIQWGAMAATLAIGVVTGTMVGRDEGPAGPEGAVVASSSLADELDTRLAADPQEGGTRIVLSFRDRSGVICRTYVDRGSQGLACRDGGAWVVRALVPAGEGQQGDIRMAAGPDPAIAAIVDRSIAGEPFDAAQEKAAKDAGWR